MLFRRILFVPVVRPGWTITAAGLRPSRQPIVRMVEVWW